MVAEAANMEKMEVDHQCQNDGSEFVKKKQAAKCEPVLSRTLLTILCAAGCIISLREFSHAASVQHFEQADNEPSAGTYFMTPCV